jgi:methionine biosynthesis protein MetW
MTDSQCFYEEYWDERFDFRFETRKLRKLAEIRFRSIRELLPGSFDSVLDIGCGEGTTLHLLREISGISGIGTDISMKTVYRASKRGFETILHSAETPFPFASRSFDLVICSEVLEHLRFPHKCLLEIRRILSEEGVVIFSIPNLGFLRNRLRLFIGRNPIDSFEYHLSEHLHHWTKAGFRTMLEDFGLKIDGVLGLRIDGLKGIFGYAYPSVLSGYLFFKATKNKPFRGKLHCSMSKVIGNLNGSI